MNKLKPVNTEHDKHKGGEEIAPGPDHHKNLASNVPSVPLEKKTLELFLFMKFKIVLKTGVRIIIKRLEVRGLLQVRAHLGRGTNVLKTG